MTNRQNFLDTAIERAELIEKLLAIGTALSSPQDLEELLTLILAKSREITWSDAGSVYLIDRTDTPRLVFKIAQNASNPAMSFREFAMPLTVNSLAGYVALSGHILNLPDAYDLPQDVPYQLDQSFDRTINYRTRSVLVMPMQNQTGDTIGVLQLINRKTDPAAVITPDNVRQVTQPFSDLETRIVRSLASQAAISIERNHLQESIEQLFEGFVRASVQIIETRDPCTSGHSERVAALTVQLSQEVNDTQQGEFAAIRFSARQIQEIRYAALLHDFGKVGVPEAVLVKAKKLYPLQLEVIRNRFALVRRTLELQCSQAKYQYLLKYPLHLLQHSQPQAGSNHCAFCQQLQALDTELATQLKQLETYWDILQQANEPRIEHQEPTRNLEELAEFTYQDLDGTLQPLLTAEEMERLMIRRGNLTELERRAIQSHVTHTYEFLKQIPWTKDLREVPTIAYSHHEKIDGSGYPQGLKRDEIPMQSQIMAIADIYDALTAGDRPYKPGLTPASALKILRQEAAHHKLNPELVELFEQRQVFSILQHSLESS
jgi:HD-GYP domain-containing protein (c-di-GMP phosphodiesterase class II)